MSNRGGNGGFSHSGVQPNHNSQRTFGTNRPQTMNHQTRHIMQPNSANISQAVSNAGIPFHHQYMSHSQPGLMHHQMPPQMPQRYPTPNQHQQIPYQFMTQIPALFYPNHALLHSPQFTAIARTVPGATSNQPYNVGQGMVTSTENLSYYNDQYMTQPPTQDVNSVNPGMQHMAAPVVPPKGTNEPKARKKAEIRDPNTDRVLTDDDLRSPVPLKPETKPSKSSTSNATSTTRENAASATDDRSQKTQEFMDGITKAATATFLKDKTNTYDKTNKSASETNRKEATLPNDTYPQSLSKEPTLIIQAETSDESAESIEISEQSSDSNIPKKKESITEKDVPIKSSQDDSVPDNSESKKSVKPTKSGESTDKAAKPSGTESAKAGPEKKVKEQISNLDVRIDNDQVTIATDVLPEPKKDSIKPTNGSTTLPFNKTVIENKPELKATEPTQISSVNKDIPKSVDSSPVSEAKDTPSEEIRSIVPIDADHVAVMVREDSVSPQDELSSPKDLSEASADSVSTNEVAGDASETEKPALDYPKVNSKGKYEYEAEFLRSLQSHPLSLKKPDLPDLDIVQQVPIPHREKQTNRINDFLPSYMAPSRNNRSLPPRIGGRNSRELRPSKPPIKIIPSPSLNQDISLHTVENAWKPAIPALKPVDNADEEEKKTVELVKRFRGILNKLTPQKYDDLIKQVDALVIDTEYRLTKVLELIFDKAVDEPAFCTDYAKLCKHISTAEKTKKSNDKKDDSSEKDDKIKEKQFRQALLSRCQKEFESGIYKDIDIEGRLKEIASINDPEKKRIAELELDEDKRKARKRSLGIIKFIGELYMFNMLSVLIMDSCILRLIDQKDDESLECLCTLLRTVGAKWEQDNAKRPKQPDGVSQTTYCISVLQGIVQNRSTSSRVRFMIQDVLDMKQAGWKVRKIQADNKPKTIEQLHAEIQQEEQTKKHEIQQHIIKTGETRKIPTKQEEWNSQRNNRSNAPNMALMIETLKKVSANAPQTENVSLRPPTWGSGASSGQGAGSSQRSQNSDSIFGRNSLNERDRNSRTSGNTMGRDSMEGRVQSSGHSFRPFSSLEGQSHSDYPGRASTGSRMPSTVAPFSSSSDSVKRDNSSRSNSMEKSRLVESRSSSSSNVARESPKKEAVSGIKFEGDPAINLSKLEERLKGAFKQYLLNGLKDACRDDVLLACTESNVAVFVEVVLGISLEFSSLDKKLAAGEVLAFLLKEKVIKQEQLIKGLHSFLTIADDLKIDIPLLWNNLADNLVPIFCSIEDSIRKKLFNKILEPIKQGEGAALTMFHLLNFKKTSKFPYDCASAWVTGGLEWSSFLPPEDKNKSPDEFFKKHNLTLPQFELQLKLDQMSNIVNKFSPAQLGENLTKYFTPEEVTEPKFLRALTQAVAMKCIVTGSNNVSHKLNGRKFSEFCAVLAKFHNGLKKLELEIIFTVQELLSDYENPKGLLTDIFECLHRKAKISDEAFIDWEADSLRVKNKGSAVHMVKEFLTRVKEGGSGSDS